MRFNGFTLAAALALTLTCPTSFASQELSSTDRCSALLDDGKAAQAEPFCAAAAKESLKGALMYGLVLEHKGDFNGAVQSYSKAMESDDAEIATAALSFRAITYYKMRDFSMASKDAVASLEHYPDDVEMLIVAARAHPSLRARLEFAERAIALEPEDQDLHLLRGYLLIDMKDGKQALASAETVLKREPKNREARELKGLAYMVMGEYSKAERQLASLARAHPDDPDLKTARAHILLTMNRFEDTIKVSTEALKLEPDQVEALRARAAAHIGMGDGSAALADITAAEKLNASWAPSLKSRAEELIRAHAAFTPQAFNERAADREVSMGSVRQHLRSKCGNYRLPQFSADMDTDTLNAGLSRYFDCLQQWSRHARSELYDNPAPHVVAANDRLHDALSVITKASELRCSQMPKRAKCVNDEVYARADSAFDGIFDPIEFIAKAEVDRINQGIDQLNRSIKRHNTSVDVANFVHELARALNE